MSDVQKFDPSTLMQGVKDRIKATFVSLIPDDQWEVMVKTEVDKFFRGDVYGYNSSTRVSDFTQVVFSVLAEHVKEKLKEALQKPDFDTGYNGTEKTISEAIKREIVNKAPEIFAMTIQNAVAQSIDNMRYR